jgi:hypothetical protein
MVYLGNDVMGLLQTGTTEGGGIAQDKPRFHLDGGRLVLDPIKVPEGGLSTGPWGRAAPRNEGFLGEVKFRLYTNSALYRFFADRWYALTHPVLETGPDDRVLYRTSDTATTSEAWSIMDALLARLRDDVSADGSRLVIAIQPEEVASDVGQWREFTERYRLDPRDWDRQEPDRRILSICERARIQCLDLLEPMAKAGRAAYIAGDGHYTPLGHDVVASELRGRLLDLGIPRSR